MPTPDPGRRRRPRASGTPRTGEGAASAPPAAPAEAPAELTDAAAAFDVLEQRALALEVPWSYAHEGLPPIVGYVTQLAIAEDRLDEVAHLGALRRPFSEWNLLFGSACADAKRRAQVVRDDMLASPPGPGPLGRRLSSDIKSLTVRLRAVSALLARQPGTTGPA